MVHENYAVEMIEIIQSYIVTTAKYDFNVYEKRIFYRIIEMLQFLLQGKKLNQRYSINKSLFELYDVSIPVAALLKDAADNNYSRVKDALSRMSRKSVQFENEAEWMEIPLISHPKIKKYENTVQFKLHENIYDALLNFTKGYKKYELKTAFNFESVYAMRFYELFSNQRTPLTFSINNLKAMFGLEEKYALTTDFIKRVIDPAQKELYAKSPFSFEYTLLKTGKKVTSIKFHPVAIPQNVSEEYETIRLRKQLSPSFYIDKASLTYLKEHYKFSTPEIRNNAALFEKANKDIPDLIMFLSEVKAKANRATNPKGYLINALRKKLKISTKPKV